MGEELEYQILGEHGRQTMKTPHLSTGFFGVDVGVRNPAVSKAWWRFFVFGLGLSAGQNRDIIAKHSGHCRQAAHRSVDPTAWNGPLQMSSAPTGTSSLDGTPPRTFRTYKGPASAGRPGRHDFWPPECYFSDLI